MGVKPTLIQRSFTGLFIFISMVLIILGSACGEDASGRVSGKPKSSPSVYANLDSKDTKPESTPWGGQYQRGDCPGCDLTDANLAGADLAGANLTKADLTRANLTNANLTSANLTAYMTGANLTGVDLAEPSIKTSLRGLRNGFEVSTRVE